MDTSDQFQRAEQEYDRLKEALAAGQIPQEQYDARVKELVAQDAQGQYWTIGENGYWVKREGPPPRKAVEPTRPSAAPPASAVPFPLPLVAGIAALCVVLFCGIGVAGLVLRSNMLGPSLAPAPSLSPATPLLPAQTEAPAATAALIPDSTLVADASTLTPTVTATVSVNSGAMSTATISANTIVNPTATVAPGVYVTGIRLDPPTPARKQDVLFTVSFLNTTNAAASMHLVVFIFKADNLKNSLGQTTAADLTIPVGQSDQKMQGWKLTGGSGCENFIAQVGTVEKKQVTLLKGTNGQLFQVPFSVC